MQKPAIIIIVFLAVVALILSAGVIANLWSASNVFVAIPAALLAIVTGVVLQEYDKLFKKSVPVEPAYAPRVYPTAIGFWRKLRIRSLATLALVDSGLLFFLIYQNWRALFANICIVGTANSCGPAFVIDYGNFGLPIYFVTAVLLLWFGLKFVRRGLS